MWPKEKFQFLHPQIMQWVLKGLDKLQRRGWVKILYIHWPQRYITFQYHPEAEVDIANLRRVKKKLEEEFKKRGLI